MTLRVIPGEAFEVERGRYMWLDVLEPGRSHLVSCLSTGQLAIALGPTAQDFNDDWYLLVLIGDRVGWASRLGLRRLRL